MTEDEAIAKVVKWCIGELGYKEGANNWNKYAALPGVQQMLALSSQAQNQPWCVIFQVAADEECFGAEVAVKIERSSMHHVPAYVSGLVDGFQMHSTPKLGDWVVYTGYTHIGRVVSVNPLQLLDGNYSDMVRYHYGSNDVLGYVTPDWYYATQSEKSADIEDDTDETSSDEFNVGDWVRCSATTDFSGMITLNSIVRNDVWKIAYLNKDNGRAVLGTNLDGTHNIMTPVNVNTLTKVVITDSANTTSSENQNNSTSANNAQADLVPEVSAFTSTATSSTASTTSTNTSYGIQGTIAEKIHIINNTATPAHTFGGRKKNVEE